MRRLRPFLMLVPLCAFGACAGPQAPAQAPAADSCNSAPLRGLVGQPGKVLEEMTLPAPSRVIGPRDPVTMDFNPARMNFEIGEDGRIAKIGCY